MQMVSCLLLIDIQNGFVSDKTKQILPRVKRLIKEGNFDHVIATRFVNQKGSPYVRFMGWEKLMLDEETKLIDFIDENVEKVFKKSIYSAVSTGLLKFAKDNSIDTFYIAGIDTDCCILKTAVDMFEKNIDFKVLLHYSASNGGRKSFNASVTVMNRLVGGSRLISGKYDSQGVEDTVKERDSASSVV
jgi:Amidases related to nicotinamidase